MDPPSIARECLVLQAFLVLFIFLVWLDAAALAVGGRAA